MRSCSIVGSLLFTAYYINEEGGREEGEGTKGVKEGGRRGREEGGGRKGEREGGKEGRKEGGKERKR